MSEYIEIDLLRVNKRFNFVRRGSFIQVIFDVGSRFGNTVFQQFPETQHIGQHITSPYHNQSNDKTKKMTKQETFKIRKAANSGQFIDSTEI